MNKFKYWFLLLNTRIHIKQNTFLLGQLTNIKMMGEGNTGVDINSTENPYKQP